MAPAIGRMSMEVYGKNIEGVLVNVDTIENLEGAITDRRKNTEEDEWWLQ